MADGNGGGLARQAEKLVANAVLTLAARLLMALTPMALGAGTWALWNLNGQVAGLAAVVSTMPAMKAQRDAQIRDVEASLDALTSTSAAHDQALSDIRQRLDGQDATLHDLWSDIASIRARQR